MRPKRGCTSLPILILLITNGSNSYGHVTENVFLKRPTVKRCLAGKDLHEKKNKHKNENPNCILAFLNSEMTNCSSMPLVLDRWLMANWFYVRATYYCILLAQMGHQKS